jgi:hypothetical protein
MTQTNCEVITLDSLDVLHYIRKTEDKLAHLHKAIDELSLKPDLVESVTILQEVAREYKIRMENAKDILMDCTIED